jgi:hypothetical protein
MEDQSNMNVALEPVGESPIYKTPYDREAIGLSYTDQLAGDILRVQLPYEDLLQRANPDVKPDTLAWWMGQHQESLSQFLKRMLPEQLNLACALPSIATIEWMMQTLEQRGACMIVASAIAGNKKATGNLMWLAAELAARAMPHMTREILKAEAMRAAESTESGAFGWALADDAESGEVVMGLTFKKDGRVTLRRPGEMSRDVAVKEIETYIAACEDVVHVTGPCKVFRLRAGFVNTCDECEFGIEAHPAAQLTDRVDVSDPSVPIPGSMAATNEAKVDEFPPEHAVGCDPSKHCKTCGWAHLICCTEACACADANMYRRLCRVNSLGRYIPDGTWQGIATAPVPPVAPNAVQAPSPLIDGLTETVVKTEAAHKKADTQG